MPILLQKVGEEVILPHRNLPDDVGLDIFVQETTILWPHQAKNIPSGWRVKVPDGTWGSIKTRSSTFRKRKLMVLEGLIDPNYTGPLSVVVFNPTLVPKIIRKGDRLAQLVIIPIESREIEIVDEMPITSRGARGFGHSGR